MNVKFQKFNIHYRYFEGLVERGGRAADDVKFSPVVKRSPRYVGTKIFGWL
jgi:hypothetical protein